MSTIQINEMSLAQLVQAVNLLADKPVKSVPSKAKGVARVEELVGDSAIEFSVDDDGAVVGFELIEEGEIEPEGDEPVETEGDEPAEEAADEGDVGSDEDAADEAVAAMPFVKATKDELAAMDAATRADYRKRRRAAARALRKAAQA